jgi:uncharacterized protein (TIGR02145 family)
MYIQNQAINPPDSTPELGYGLLYNWYAATDVRGVAPTGFRVPSQTDLNNLVTAVSTNYSTLKGTRVLVDGDPYWESSGEGTNTSGFNFYSAGGRSGFDGSYFLIRVQGTIFSTTQGVNVFALRLGAFGQGLADSTGVGNGASIRCVSDTEPLNATVQDQDGNNYTWVQIGSQYWLVQNLRTTSYNNGDPIPTGLDNAAWAATTDGAWAYPNGDSNLPI